MFYRMLAYALDCVRHELQLRIERGGCSDEFIADMQSLRDMLIKIIRYY